MVFYRFDTALYFEREDSYKAVYTDDGILCSLHFDVSSDIKGGDELDIRLYYGEDDFLSEILNFPSVSEGFKHLTSPRPFLRPPQSFP